MKDTETRSASVAPLRITRHSMTPPKQFLVLGERSSGTNLLSVTIRQNLNLTPYTAPIWKHGFPTFPALPEDCLTVAISRRADAWVRSMFSRPWHATGQIRGLEFSEFIRHPWDSVIDNRFMFKAYVDTPLARRPLQYDRHPITGKPFENIFRLRTAKLKALTGLHNRGIDVAFASLETILADPAAYLNGLAAAYDLPPPTAPALPEKRMGGADSWAHRTLAPPTELSAEDHDFMVSQLDTRLEARLGYSYA